MHREGRQNQTRGAEVKREIRAERRVHSDGRNRVNGLQARCKLQANAVLMVLHASE